MFPYGIKHSTQLKVPIKVVNLLKTYATEHYSHMYSLYHLLRGFGLSRPQNSNFIKFIIS